MTSKIKLLKINVDALVRKFLIQILPSDYIASSCLCVYVYVCVCI